MATYAIGDVQGCFEPLRRLVDRIGFDAGRDRLWFVGDLVNRGPRSLAVLRWVRDLGARAVVVLGNHDLHLLARAAGVVEARARDTLEEVLRAADRDDLLDWHGSRPLLHREGDHVLVHAGLLPQWTVEDAARHAREAEEMLQGPGRLGLLAALGGVQPARWVADAPAPERALATLAVLTRLRFCTDDGGIRDAPAFPPDEAPDGHIPWFRAPGRRSAGATVVFGHWAALGGLAEPDLLGLDTACVWGRRLTAVRLVDRRTYSVGCEGALPSSSRRRAAP